MKINERYLPEGKYTTPDTYDLAFLQKAKENNLILQANVNSCTASHNLTVSLGDFNGIIPREQCAIGIDNGTTREIAILSRVGKPVCFNVTDINDKEVILSRTKVQQEATDWFMENLVAGDVLKVRITHIESFGIFVDIGCGVISLIGIENLSVSRIFHPSERFTVGKDIVAAVLNVDKKSKRITLTHKELLGTWEENSAIFTAGETVCGIVRSIESYGIFIELTPNLSGLAEHFEGAEVGNEVSVYIKSIIPERMKIKLSIISVVKKHADPLDNMYFIPEDRISSWVYTPTCCNTKFISTDFD